MVSKEPSPQLEDLADEALLSRFTAERDRNAFSELHKRHARKVFLSCFAFLRNHAEAEDTTQETFVRAYERPHLFRSGDVAGWLLTIARNMCIDKWRKKRSEAPWEEVPEKASPGEPHDVLSRLLLSRTMQIVKTLPREQRICIELNLKGYSYDEMSSQIGGSSEDVRRHLQNAKREIRRQTGLHA